MEEMYRQAARWDQWAPVYDGLATGRRPEHDADRMLALAPTGTALELGCGTGLVALEVARLGTTVRGLDVSPRMVDVFNAKATMDDLSAHATVGDMAHFSLGEEFTLIYAVASTLFALTSQDDQVACFRHAAEHLVEGGLFIVEAEVPRWRPDAREKMAVREVTDDHAHWTAMIHNSATQTVRSQEIRADSEGMHLLPMVSRYMYPAEMDLMARLAGLRRLHRWGGWDSQFTADSRRHLSVYIRDAPDGNQHTKGMRLQ
jgi:trans-aconitate methyltransferase